MNSQADQKTFPLTRGHRLGRLRPSRAVSWPLSTTRRKSTIANDQNRTVHNIILEDVITECHTIRTEEQLCAWENRNEFKTETRDVIK